MDFKQQKQIKSIVLILYKYIHICNLIMPYHESMCPSPRALVGGGWGMCAGRGNRGTSVLANRWNLWRVRSELLKSGTSSELVLLSRSLRARIPGSLRLPVAAVTLRGAEGDSGVSGDRDNRAMSGDKACLGCRSKKQKKVITKVLVAAITVCNLLVYHLLRLFD